MLIEDGKGSGFKAQIDDENCLCVNSVCNNAEHHANHIHGSAYTMDIDGVVVDGDGYYFLYIKNTDDEDLIVTSITLRTGQNKDDDDVEVHLGHTLSSVANHTAIVPANVNAGCGLLADGTFYVNDGAGNLTTLAGGVVAGRYKFTTTQSKWSKSTDWIIPKNQTFSLLTAKDNKFYGYVSFFFHNAQLLGH